MFFSNFPTGDFSQYQFNIDFRHPRQENIKKIKEREDTAPICNLQSST